MKNYQKTVFKTLLMCSIGLGAMAQLKVGSNPTSIDANANLQVQSTDGSQVIVTKNNGSLGVGTLTPTEKLTVSGNGLFNNTGNFSFSRYISAGGVTTQIGSSSASSSFGAGAFLGTTTNDPINFLINNVPKMRLTGNELVPNGSNLVALGSTIDRWNNIFGGSQLNMFNPSADFVFSRYESQSGTISQIGSSSFASVFGAGMFVGTVTNNPINFIINNIPTIRLTGNEFKPNGPNIIALGTAADRWKEGFINNIRTFDIGVGTDFPSRQVQVAPGNGILVGNTFGSGFLYRGNASNGGVELVGEADGGYISAQRNGDAPSLHVGKRVGANGDALVEFYLNNVVIGSIRLDGTTGVKYNTTSDMRLKTNIKETSNGINAVLKMNPVDYSFKSDKTNTIQTGFLAQELYKIFPQAVAVGGADENIKPWSVDYSKLTPVLVKAIQEQQAMIEALKSKLTEFNDLKAEMASIKSLLDNVEASKASK